MIGLNIHERYTLQAALYRANSVTILGGAQSHNHEEWAREWNLLTEGAKGETWPGLALVKSTISGDVVDRLAVDAATVERLLGRSLQDLIAQGQAFESPSLVSLRNRAGGVLQPTS